MIRAPFRTALAALALALVTAAAAPLGSVRAAPTAASHPAPMTAAARTYFDRGAAAYGAGDYAGAIALLERGRQLDDHPDFLYALAQAYRRLGDCPRAIALYQAFLATHPADAEAARARANLERCPLAESPPPATPAIAPPAPPPLDATAAPHDGSPWYTDVAGAVLLGAGAIGAGAGATYLVLGDLKIRDASATHMLGQFENLVETGHRDRRIGAVCVAVGGAVMLGAMVRYALVRHADRAAVRSVWLAPRQDAVIAGWEARF